MRTSIPALLLQAALLVPVLTFLMGESGEASSFSECQETLFYHLIPKKMAAPRVRAYPHTGGTLSGIPWKGPTVNLIFSLGDPSGEADHGQIKKFEKLGKDILSLRFDLNLLRYRKLLMGKNHYRGKKSKILRRLRELTTVQSTLKQAVRTLEGRELKSRFSKIKDQTLLDWQFLEGATTGSISKALWNSPVRHAIIVGHGDSGGFLFDSERNPFHLSFFNNIPPWVQSISIFSCHCEKMTEIYRIDFSKGPSFYPVRYFSTLRDHRLLFRKGVVWSGGFSEFLRQTDRFLAKVNDQYPEKNTQEFINISPGNCYISSQGIHALEGQWDVILNRQWLGALDSPETQQTIAFDCNFLKPGINVLLLQQGNAQWPPEIALSADWAISITRQGVSFRPVKDDLLRATEYANPLSIKGIFSLPSPLPGDPSGISLGKAEFFAGTAE